MMNARVIEELMREELDGTGELELHRDCVKLTGLFTASELRAVAKLLDGHCKAAHLAPVQLKVYEYIAGRVNAGLPPPTRVELQKQFGWGSPNACETHIKALEKRGLIKRMKGRRNIALTDQIPITARSGGLS